MLELTAINKIDRSEVFYLTTLVDRVSGGIEGFDVGDTGLAGDEVLPELFYADPYRRHDPKAGYDDAALGVTMYFSRAH